MSTSNYKIDFIRKNYQRFYKKNEKAIDKAIKTCHKNGDYTLRKEVWDLEKNIAKFVGTKYCATVGSGTDALFLSLLALGIGKGDEVITVSNTFIATIQAIVHTGATPILIDVNDDELMDVSKLEASITPYTKAIIPVQYTGAICDMAKIKEIADKYKIHIVDDYCQALGAKGAGTFGILNCVSFNTAKLLGGIGDGGAVTTDSRELFEKVCLLRNHWNVHQLSVDRKDYSQPEQMGWGWKSRIANVNAAFLNVKFKTIKSIIKRREQIALKYNKAFKDISHLGGTPHEQDGRIWQEYHFLVIERELFAKYMKKHGIETLTRDSIPNHKMKGLGLEQFHLPTTETLANLVIRLPLHEHLTDKEVNYVIQTVKNYFK